MSAFAGYSINHNVDGCSVDCDRCGHTVIAPGYGLQLVDVVKAVKDHNTRCLG